MAQTVVYGCDWCDQIVKKDGAGEPQFAAKITAEQLITYPPMAGGNPRTYDICGDCLKVFKAVTEGRFRR